MEMVVANLLYFTYSKEPQNSIVEAPTLLTPQLPQPLQLRCTVGQTYTPRAAGVGTDPHIIWLGLGV